MLTSDRARPRDEAVAVRAGRIAFVGSAEDAREWVGPHTEVIELSGRTLLPGFQDAHVHLASSGLGGLQCDLRAAAAPAAYGELIRAYAASHPDEEWIVGDGWGSDDFGGPMPTRQQLDAIVADRPVYLETRDAHTAWVNSLALERAGVTASTRDPEGGLIDRDDAGAPSGTLQESARRLVRAHLPEPSAADWQEAIRRAQAELHSYGVTACQEANLTPDLFEPYRAVAGRGELTIRLEGNLAWDSALETEQLEGLLDRRARGTVGRMRIRGAKLFQDGVAENFTAAMLEPYRDAAGAHTANAGLSMFAPERLARDVTLLDAHGFQVHVHALGDRAVREALDALEAAARANGRRDARHHLAHLQFVHPEDLPRFAALGVVANVTPLWAVLDGYVTDLTLPFVGERAAATMYPFASLARAGARLAVGSDWSVSSPDPLLQVAVAALRRMPDEPGAEPLLPAERLDVAAALEAATLGSAYVNHLDAETGSITVGKLADLVVLDRDLAGAGPAEIAEARVVLTLVEGETVYASPEGRPA